MLLVVLEHPLVLGWWVLGKERSRSRCVEKATLAVLVGGSKLAVQADCEPGLIGHLLDVEVARLCGDFVHQRRP